LPASKAMERKQKLLRGLWCGFWVVVVYVAICAVAGPGGENTKVDNGHQRKLRATFGQPDLAEQFPLDPKKTTKAPSFMDKGDFYRVAGKKKELYRSTEKIVLRFKKTAGRETRSEIVARGEFWEPLERSKQVSKRDLFILNVKDAVKPEQLQQMIDGLREEVSAELVWPVYIAKETGKELLVADELIVKLKDEVSEEELWQMNALHNVSLIRRLRGTSNQYILRVNDPKRHSVLETAEAYYDTGIVEWAEPNFIFELELGTTPNDPNFSDQWHLHNTGQGGGTVDADVDAPEAWDVDLDHPDLEDKLLSGYDFYEDHDTPDPGPTGHPHGTSCAGVAAAVTNNSLGVAGIGWDCKILPVKISSDSGTFASDSVIAEALYWAADNADVLSNSWGGGGDSSAIHTAIQHAKSSGRGGKGCPVFFASGNDATGFMAFELSGFTAGTYTFKWEYVKDSSVSEGEDSVWLDGIVFPGGELQSFEGSFPPEGWTTEGDSSWSISTTHALTGWDGEGTSQAAKAGSITDDESTWLEVTKAVDAGVLRFYAWVSSEAYYDFFNLYVNETRYFHYSGVLAITTAVGYPARYPECIATGASTNFDYRSDYSQYDSTLDIVAPSNWGSRGITTTDIAGSGGYSSGDYTSTFGGTSSATPLAAGVAALMLSQDPDLTADNVQDILQETANKIGNIAYSGGRNDYYGYGRVNADAALASRISVTVDPLAWSIGVVNMGETAETGPNYFTATNDGNVPEDFAIQCGNSGQGWTCGAAAGIETFSMKAQGGDLTDWTAIHTSQILKTNVAEDGAVTFDLQFRAPTATVHLDNEHSITVTVTASVH
jgi:subtilisin family serine protease